MDGETFRAAGNCAPKADWRSSSAWNSAALSQIKAAGDAVVEKWRVDLSGRNIRSAFW